MGRLTRDFLGYINYGVRINRIALSGSITTLIMKFQMLSKGIKYGSKVRFNGISHFFRMPESSIIIGNYNRFRSDFTSNLVGINRKCLIATLRKKAMLTIGDHCGLSGTVIGAAKNIEIGDRVLFGANSFVTDFDWHNSDPELRHQECHNAKSVKIENNVWLGMNTIVLKGVTIGENSVIGANSVVVGDIPSNVIAAGNPCRVIKSI